MVVRKVRRTKAADAELESLTVRNVFLQICGQDGTEKAEKTLDNKWDRELGEAVLEGIDTLLEYKSKLKEMYRKCEFEPPKTPKRTAKAPGYLSGLLIAKETISKDIGNTRRELQYSSDEEGDSESQMDTEDAANTEDVNAVNADILAQSIANLSCDSLSDDDPPDVKPIVKREESKSPRKIVHHQPTSTVRDGPPSGDQRTASSTRSRIVTNDHENAAGFRLGTVHVSRANTRAATAARARPALKSPAPVSVKSQSNTVVTGGARNPSRHASPRKKPVDNVNSKKPDELSEKMTRAGKQREQKYKEMSERTRREREEREMKAKMKRKEDEELQRKKLAEKMERERQVEQLQLLNKSPSRHATWSRTQSPAVVRGARTATRSPARTKATAASPSRLVVMTGRSPIRTGAAPLVRPGKIQIPVRSPHDVLFKDSPPVQSPAAAPPSKKAHLNNGGKSATHNTQSHSHSTPKRKSRRDTFSEVEKQRKQEHQKKVAKKAQQQTNSEKSREAVKTPTAQADAMLATPPDDVQAPTPKATQTLVPKSKTPTIKQEVMTPPPPAPTKQSVSPPVAVASLPQRTPEVPQPHLSIADDEPDEPMETESHAPENVKEVKIERLSMAEVENVPPVIGIAQKPSKPPAPQQTIRAQQEAAPVKAKPLKVPPQQLKQQNNAAYDMTPAKIYVAASADNYGIDDLNSDDETDDEDRPRKQIPQWARGDELRRVVRSQYVTNYDLETFFGPIPEVRLENIFGEKKKFKPRTSSAVWSSPLSQPRPGFSTLPKGSPVPFKRF